LKAVNRHIKQLW